jgi:hypothetical protein
MLGLPEIQISATTYVLQVLTGLILPLVVAVVTLARHATVELEG